MNTVTFRHAVSCYLECVNIARRFGWEEEPWINGILIVHKYMYGILTCTCTYKP